MAEAPIPPRFYANAMRVQGGPYDLALDFGQRVGSEEPEWQLQVLTNWEHAKAMAEALVRVVQQYESDLGSVRNIEEAAAAMTEARESEHGR